MQAPHAARRRFPLPAPDNGPHFANLQRGDEASGEREEQKLARL